MMPSTVWGLSVEVSCDRSIFTPSTVSEPIVKVPLEVVVAPVCCVAVHCRPPSTTEPCASEISPTLEVAVAVRVSPLSMEVCEVELRPEIVSRPPGTVMAATLVLESDEGCVVAVAASVPTPSGEEAGVMVSLRVWLPLTDSACTDGGTSLAGRVGGPPEQPAASRAVPMAPRSRVCDSDCASMSWYFEMEVARMMA